MPEATRPESTTPRGLFSVAQIQHVLRVEFGRAQRYRYPLVCLLVAVDQLGGLRDRFGYEIKEEALAAVVSLLQRSTRSSDFLGRTADDRLMAVIPHTSLAGARALAERLRRGAATLEIARAKGATPITLSLGLSSNQTEGVLYYDALLSAAESALADASAAGGDRLCERAPRAPTV
jgi:diguanylate cyclase (GGDEF)-like protein